MEVLVTPWQSVGAKGVVTLASKLMLALLLLKPASLSCRWMRQKLQRWVRWTHELNQSWIFRLQIERTLMENIAASNDRVVIHQAMKHLVVSGNA